LANGGFIMKAITEKQFMNLPDWEKVSLIDAGNVAFNSVMTVDEENKRMDVLREIILKFVDNTFVDSNILLHMPYYFYTIITPKLLDIISVDVLGCFGSCRFCDKFCGVNEGHYKIKHKKVESISAYCSNKNKIVKAKYVCQNWIPNKLFNDIINLRINKAIEKSNKYTFDDYMKDLSMSTILKSFGPIGANRMGSADVNGDL
jgi:hypothetical protein